MLDGVLTTDVEPAIASTRFFSRQHGDLRIWWKQEDHEAVIPQIQKLMDSGVHFFIIEPPKGRRKERETRVTDLAKQAGGLEVFVKDPDICTVCASGVTNIANIAGVEPLKTIRPAKDAKEAAQNQTVGVRAGSGG